MESQDEELRETVGVRSSRPVVFPLSSCQGHLTRYVYNCIAEIENNYFNFAEGGKNNENKRVQRKRLNVFTVRREATCA